MRRERHWRSLHQSTVLVQSLVALGSVALGIVGRLLLERVLSPDALLVFVFSVILAARAGGLGAGLIATVLSMIVGNYLFLPPLHRFGIPDIRETVRLAFFLIEGSTISMLFHQVQRSEAAERRARDQLRQFLAMVSHELRNPLTALTSSAHILARRNPTVRASAVLMRQIQQLNRMVGDISDLSRLERAALDIRPSMTSVNTLLESAIDIAAPEFLQRGQSFESTLLATDVSVNADAVRMQQVIANLLINASRYSPSGAVVRLVSEHASDRLMIRVSDNGRGFSPEDAAHLFEPFFRGASDQPGTGLGLAISKTLVERHGGTIAADSDGPGCGATFTIALPVAAAPASPAPASDARVAGNPSPTP